MPTELVDLSDRLPATAKLRSLGFETLEQVVAASKVVPHELTDALGMDIQEALRDVSPLAEAIPADLAEELAELATPFGAVLPPRPAHFDVPLALATAAAPRPASLNYVADMPAIRNQGTRDTCVPFATLAAYEHVLTLQRRYVELSEQFLYWDCKENDGNTNTPGTSVDMAFSLLRRDGCCPAAGWDYNAAPIPGNEPEGPPLPGVQSQALAYRVKEITRIPPNSVQDFKTILQSRRCIAFAFPVYNSINSDQTKLTGDILTPLPGEAALKLGHAVCIVGYVDMPDHPELGGGRFIIRNSWGEQWGRNSPFGAGYGTIPYLYVGRLGSEAYSIG